MCSGKYVLVVRIYFDQKPRVWIALTGSGSDVGLVWVVCGVGCVRLTLVKSIQVVDYGIDIDTR